MLHRRQHQQEGSDRLAALGRCALDRAPSATTDTADAAATIVRRESPSFHEKLYLNDKCTLKPSLRKPSEKFSRRPHWSSLPAITLGAG